MNEHVAFDADPTGLGDIRDGLEREVTRRWVGVAREVKRALVQHDALGIGDKAPQLAMPTADKAALFKRWLDEKLMSHIAGYDGLWLGSHLDQASKRGVGRVVMGDAGPDDEPRDKEGKWTSGGSTGVSEHGVRSTNPDGGHLLYHWVDKDQADAAIKAGVLKPTFTHTIPGVGKKKGISTGYGARKWNLQDPDRVALVLDRRKIDAKAYDIPGNEVYQAAQSPSSNPYYRKQATESIRHAERDEAFFTEPINLKKALVKVLKASDPEALKDAQQNLAFLVSRAAPSAAACHAASVGHLATICEETSELAHGAVASGLLQRARPGRIAKLVDQAMGHGLKRTRMLAEHAVTQAYSQATLDALEASGVTHVGTVSEHRRKLKDFDPDEPRDEIGRWTAAGSTHAGYEFVSPNVEQHPSLEAAQGAVASPRHAAMLGVSHEIDAALGLKSSDQTIIGAWADGAENSVMTALPDASWDQVRLSAAMKGHVGDQKQVLAFKQDDTGDAVLYNFSAKGTLEAIHQSLLADGVAFHTLAPSNDGAEVYVVDTDGQAHDAVDRAARRANAPITYQRGRADFLGSQLESGTDREVRDDARRAYEEIIRQSPVPHGAEVWASHGDRWGQALSAASQGADRSAAGGGGGGASLRAAQASAAEVAEGHAPLQGLPQKPIELDGALYVPGPIGRIRDAAERYMAGKPYAPPTSYVKLDKERAGRIAAAYDAMPNAPDDPAVKASYAAMTQETLAQWQEVKRSGLKVDWIQPGQADPYASNPRAAAMDVAQNNHWWGYPTDLGYGSEDATSRANNPMLADSGEVIGGRKALVNDVFRVVHDYFGHFKEGNGFRAEGEDNAWRSHASMFSREALPAMTAETRGQNSWVNYGPYGETNRKASAGETHYAPQKIGIMPDWAFDDIGKGHVADALEDDEVIVEGQDGALFKVVRHGDGWAVIRIGDAAPDDEPRDERGRWTVSYSGRQGEYDPKFFRAEDDPLTDEHGVVVGNRQKLVPTREANDKPPIEDDPSLMYRGMSHAEYEAFRTSGEIKTKGDYNLSNQAGLTYFTTESRAAETYANAFAPWAHKPDFGKPAYIVAAKRVGAERLHRVEGTGEHELGVMGPVAKSDVTGIWRGTVIARDPGEKDRLAPSAQLHWQKVMDALDAWDEWFADAARISPQPKHPKTGKFARAHIVAREMRRSKRTGQFRRQGLSPEEQRKEELTEARFGRVIGRLDVMTQGDDRVCDACDEISANGPYGINEARSLIPAHPNCRCLFVAAGTIQDAWIEDFSPDEPRDPQGRWTALAGSQGHYATISTANITGTGRSAAEKEESARRKTVYQQPSVATLKQNPDLFKFNVGLFHQPDGYPYFRPDELKGTADEVSAHIVDRMADNLVWLAKDIPKAKFESWRQWYDGAHKLAESDAKEFGVDLASSAGAYAALSPQKVWEENVYLAHTVMDVVHNQRDHRWDETMTDTASGKGKIEGIWKPKDQKLLALIKGKTLGELDDASDPARLAKMAMWVRTYDQAHNDRHFGTFDPATGKVSKQPMLSKANEPLTARWQSIPAVANAIAAFTSGGDANKLSAAMGGVHKVRSFYNNILDPHSANGDVTVDTHAVGAALLYPSTGSTTPVLHALATTPSDKEKIPKGYVPAKGSEVTGAFGTYGLYADAYRKAAKELNVEPRELQSIVWMRKQELFGDQTGSNVMNAVDAVWRGYAKGEYDLNVARTKVIAAAEENRPKK